MEGEWLPPGLCGCLGVRCGAQGLLVSMSACHSGAIRGLATEVVRCRKDDWRAGTANRVLPPVLAGSYAGPANGKCVIGLILDARGFLLGDTTMKTTFNLKLMLCWSLSAWAYWDTQLRLDTPLDCSVCQGV